MNGHHHDLGLAGEMLANSMLHVKYFPSSRGIFRIHAGADFLVVMDPPYGWTLVEVKTGKSSLTSYQEKTRLEYGNEHYCILWMDPNLLSSDVEGARVMRMSGQRRLSPYDARDLIKEFGLKR